MAKRCNKGSPPQVRGKPIFQSLYFSKPRITPAGAGKTITVMCKIIIDKDHPRRCGENYHLSIYERNIIGSPPQVRGKPLSLLVLLRHTRITPAGAGKTHHQFPILRECQDHPRRCGENYLWRRRRIVSLGSPPQVRGKRLYTACMSWMKWITPAGAGKTKKGVAC